MTLCCPFSVLKSKRCAFMAAAREHATWWFALVAFAFLLRLPFMVQPFLETEEGNYLLMAQDWVRGYLPYERVWQPRPPLGIAFFAPIIAVFGNVIVPVRVLGALWLGLSACFVYQAGVHAHSKRAGVLAGLAVVAFTTLYCRAVTPEVVAMLPLSMLAYGLCRKGKPCGVWLGFALATALLVRTNLALLWLPLVWVVWQEAGAAKAKAVALFTLCALLPVAGFALLYMSAGHFSGFSDAMLDMSRVFAPGKMLSMPYLSIHGTVGLVCFVAACYGVAAVFFEPHMRAVLPAGFVRMLPVAAATLVSVWLMGGLFGAPFAMVLPFLGVVGAVLLCVLWKRHAFGKAVAGTLLAGFCFALLPYVQTIPTGGRMRGWAESPVWRATGFFQALQIEGRHVFAPNAAVLNYLSNTLPPTVDMNGKGIDAQPEFVVFIKGRAEERGEIGAFVLAYYHLMYEDPDGNFRVYQVDPHDTPP